MGVFDIKLNNKFSMADGVNWGGIGGDITSQNDLNNALSLVVKKTASGAVAINRAVNFDGEATDDGAEILGASMNAAADGGELKVSLSRLFYLEASASVSAGDDLVLDTGGKVKAYQGVGTKVGTAVVGGENGEIVTIKAT